MKVTIGKYKDYWGPYQIADLIKHLGFSEEKCDAFGDWLSESRFNPVINWLDKHFGKRKVKVKIDEYDVWNMDSTLSVIVLPLLQEYNRQRQGHPLVDDEDVPEFLKSTNGKKPSEYEWDDLSLKRWSWVIEEMIWTFQQLQPDCDWDDLYYKGDIDFVSKNVENTDLSELVRGPNHTFEVDKEGLNNHQDRINNGLRLFGRYYQSLWD